jgi:filamentous hemagglutinin family protein
LTTPHDLAVRLDGEWYQKDWASDWQYQSKQTLLDTRFPEDGNQLRAVGRQVASGDQRWLAPQGSVDMTGGTVEAKNASIEADRITTHRAAFNVENTLKATNPGEKAGSLPWHSQADPHPLKRKDGESSWWENDTGVIHADRVEIKGFHLYNKMGTQFSANTFSFSGNGRTGLQPKLLNNNSLIRAGQLDIEASLVSNSNSKGSKESGIHGDTIRINTESLTNAGDLVGKETVEISALSVNNNNGYIFAGKSLRIPHRAGSSSSKGKGHLTIHNQGGVLQSEGELTLDVEPKEGEVRRPTSMPTANTGSLAGLGLPIFSGTIQTDTTAPIGWQPTVTLTSLGVPVVYLAPPTAQGVSINHYKQFDVSSLGVWLNNAQAPVTLSTGDVIGANPNLAQGAAKIIVNQVNSSTPGELSGPIHVAGQPAKVIIAHPGGLKVGDTMISVPSMLTTGAWESTVSPPLQGHIDIVGNPRLSDADVLANTITVRNPLQGKTLSLIASDRIDIPQSAYSTQNGQPFHAKLDSCGELTRGRYFYSVSGF